MYEHLVMLTEYFSRKDVDVEGAIMEIREYRKKGSALPSNLISILKQQSINHVYSLNSNNLAEEKSSLLGCED